MNLLALIAITWIGKEYRFLGLDWSYLMVLGFIGNALFSMRFLVQWLASERQGESIIPVSFWYWSIAGSILMCVYFVFRRDPIGILAYLPNSMIYIRNLMLIRKRKFAFTAAAPSQHPREENIPIDPFSSKPAWFRWHWVLWLLGIIVALAMVYYWTR
jgi:lipid-A-disaccharide synthase-like uncharacterized protein